MDDERQRGARGPRRRYFLARMLARERDGCFRRVRLTTSSRRRDDAAAGVHSGGRGLGADVARPARLALPAPAFLPLAGDGAGGAGGASKSGARDGLRVRPA